MKAIIQTVEENSDYKCYDVPPKNKKPPFYYAELVQVRPSNSKTMWREIYVVNFHCIAPPIKTSIPVYDLIDTLEELLTIEVQLPEPYFVVTQTSEGLQTINKDETNEKHAVVQVNFDICYGFKSK